MNSRVQNAQYVEFIDLQPNESLKNLLTTVTLGQLMMGLKLEE